MLGVVDEPLAQPGAWLNPGARLQRLAMELPEALQLGNGAGVMNVILLQAAEIGIRARVQLLMQPGGACFLGPDPQQENPWRIGVGVGDLSPAV